MRAQVMKTSYQKSTELPGLAEFVTLACNLEYFQAGDTLYEVLGSDEEELIYVPLDQKQPIQGINLHKLHAALIELPVLSGKDFSAYIRQSQQAVAKGILSQLGLLIPQV